MECVWIFDHPKIKIIANQQLKNCCHTANLQNKSIYNSLNTMPVKKNTGFWSQNIKKYVPFLFMASLLFTN
jgi:hypothetical protein